MMAEIKLLGTEASFPCARIVWALKVKGLAFEFVEENLLNKSSLLLQMNPVHKKVPVLIHDGNPVVESLVILEYIDETWKDNYPLLPQDPYHRAMARFWAKVNDEKAVLSMWQAMASNGDEKAIESAHEALKLLEKQIEGKKFFGGENIGFLDIVVGWVSLWLGAMEEVGGIKVFDPVKFPSLTEWTINFVQVPVIKESLPPKQKVVDYFQFGLDYVRSMPTNK